jgi:hypothetical protein
MSWMVRLGRMSREEGPGRDGDGTGVFFSGFSGISYVPTFVALFSALCCLFSSFSGYAGRYNRHVQYLQTTGFKFGYDCQQLG